MASEVAMAGSRQRRCESMAKTWSLFLGLKSSPFRSFQEATSIISPFFFRVDMHPTWQQNEQLGSAGDIYVHRPSKSGDICDGLHVAHTYAYTRPALRYRSLVKAKINIGF